MCIINRKLQEICKTVSNALAFDCDILLVNKLLFEVTVHFPFNDLST